MDPDNRLKWGTGRKALIREKDYNCTSPFAPYRMSRAAGAAAARTVGIWMGWSLVILLIGIIVMTAGK